MFKSFKQLSVFLTIQSSYYSFSKGPLTPIKSDRLSSDFSQASVNLIPLPTWYYFPHVWWLWKQVIKLIGLFNFHSYLSCHHKFQPSEDGKMLVLLYLEEIFIFTTFALLNPAVFFSWLRLYDSHWKQFQKPLQTFTIYIWFCEQVIFLPLKVYDYLIGRL